MTYATPEIRSLVSEKIFETIGSIKTQYQQTFNEDLPATGPTGSYYDDWNFDAEAGTQISVTATPAATLALGIWGGVVPPPPVLFNVSVNGLGGVVTGSAVVPSTGTYQLSVFTCCGGGSGTYSVVISSDRPLTNWVVLTDDDYV